MPPTPHPASLDAADMAAVIERATADLALAEEPARFLAALERAAPSVPPPGASVAAPAATPVGGWGGGAADAPPHPD